MLPPVMSCETAYKSSPLHWKRYAVREVLGTQPPALRDNPRCHGRALAQERSGPLEKVVALRSDAMYRSSDGKSTSAALRLERTNLHPKPPIVRSGCRRQPRVVLCACKRAVISRTAAVDINSLSHLHSWLGVMKAQIACGVLGSELQGGRCLANLSQAATRSAVDATPSPKVLKLMPGNAC